MINLPCPEARTCPEVINLITVPTIIFQCHFLSKIVRSLLLCGFAIYLHFTPYTVNKYVFPVFLPIQLFNAYRTFLIGINFLGIIIERKSHMQKVDENGETDRYR